MLISLFIKIGQAVAVALEHGMHTEMRSDSLDEGYVARCRRLWWTIHILERYISSHLGVPMAVTDDFISTPYHTFPDDAQKTAALQIQVRLSQVLSLIQHSRLFTLQSPSDAGVLKSLLQRCMDSTGNLTAAT